MSIPPVFHGSAKAISPAEFIAALKAVTPPRFPWVKAGRSRGVVLAISGGVDSMALAYLCSQATRYDYGLRIADHPVKRFSGLIVDHKLREGSTQEARAVRKVLSQKLGIGVDIVAVNWRKELASDVDPNTVPNIESLARRARYRLIASAMHRRVSVLMAHHEDDQYETVLMRLLSGHGVRGLRGMKGSADIPECADMHGIHQSGFLDDLDMKRPWYTFGITKKQRKTLKHAMRADIDSDMLAREIHDGYRIDVLRHPSLFDENDSYGSSNNDYYGGGSSISKRRAPPPPLEPMDFEDGGVRIYRPLLEFSKERLIATCLENDIPWFEDHTNQDPALTMRNAVRHLVKNHTLPVALQKPAILQLAQRCRDKVAAEDAEADRLLQKRTLMHEFEPNVGSLIVELPTLKFPTVPRRSSAFRRERKREHYVWIASILIQKLLAIVSPESHLTTLPNLASSTTMRLFPSLAPSTAQHPSGTEAKAFVVCGVHFIPLSPPQRWYLVRAPYSSTMPRPMVQVQRSFYTRRWRRSPQDWTWSKWSTWARFDERFWLSVRCRVPFEVTVAPFEAEFAKQFRESLWNDREREGLAAKLRRYAPGKTRYTLPAVYVRGDVEGLIEGGGEEYVVDEEEVRLLPNALEDTELRTPRAPKLKALDWWIDRERGTAMAEERKGEQRGLEGRKVRLVALPTLGVGMPGIEGWVECRVRYKKVDARTLALGREAVKERIGVVRREKGGVVKRRSTRKVKRRK